MFRKIFDTAVWVKGHLTATALTVAGTIKGGTITGANVTSGDEPGHTHSTLEGQGGGTTITPDQGTTNYLATADGGKVFITDDSLGDISDEFYSGQAITFVDGVSPGEVRTVSSVQGYTEGQGVRVNYEGDQILAGYTNINAASYDEGWVTAQRIGIRTDAPDSALHVVGTVNVDSPLLGLFRQFIDFNGEYGISSYFGNVIFGDPAGSNTIKKYVLGGYQGTYGVVVDQTDTAEIITTIKDIAKLEGRATAPATPAEGMMYHNTTDNKIHVYLGAAWNTLDMTAVV